MHISVLLKWCFSRKSFSRKISTISVFTCIPLLRLLLFQILHLNFSLQVISTTQQKSILGLIESRCSKMIISGGIQGMLYSVCKASSMKTCFYMQQLCRFSFSFWCGSVSTVLLHWLSTYISAVYYFWEGNILASQLIFFKLFPQRPSQTLIVSPSVPAELPTLDLYAYFVGVYFFCHQFNGENKE